MVLFSNSTPYNFNQIIRKEVLWAIALVAGLLFIGYSNNWPWPGLVIGIFLYVYIARRERFFIHTVTVIDNDVLLFEYYDWGATKQLRIPKKEAGISFTRERWSKGEGRYYMHITAFGKKVLRQYTHHGWNKSHMDNIAQWAA